VGNRKARYMAANRKSGVASLDHFFNPSPAFGLAWLVPVGLSSGHSLLPLP
jgi:hypothetical protein